MLDSWRIADSFSALFSEKGVGQMMYLGALFRFIDITPKNKVDFIRLR